jgi:hypothetical protein
MTELTAYMPGIKENSEVAYWKFITDPPYVVSYAGNDFVEVPEESGLSAYVNGFKVVGLQVLEPGDFVRVFSHRKKKVSFRFAGRTSVTVEPGDGRICAFTRIPIKGMAVICRRCGKVLSEEVMKQIGSCLCGSPLKHDAKQDQPSEDLL